jgi:hypothetical protein
MQEGGADRHLCQIVPIGAPAIDLRGALRFNPATPFNVRLRTHPRLGVVEEGEPLQSGQIAERLIVVPVGRRANRKELFFEEIDDMQVVIVFVVVAYRTSIFSFSMISRVIR